MEGKEVMQPDWQTKDGSIRLYCNDAMHVLPSVSQFDLALVDIPYGEVNRESGGLRNLDKGAADITTFALSDVVSHCSRIAESSYVWCGIEQVSELRAGFVDAGMTTRLCIWEKTNPSPMNGEKFWLSSIECCVFARKSKAYFSEHCASAVWRGPIERDQIHPTQKPEWLFERIIKASCPPSGSVIDFCLGSGTTAVVCRKLDRRCLGVELDREHFTNAVARIEAELKRAPLFEAAPEIQRTLI